MAGWQGHNGPERIRTTCPGGGARSQEKPLPGHRAHAHEVSPVPGHHFPARELVRIAQGGAELPPWDLAGVATTHVAERDPVVVPGPFRVGGMGARVLAVQHDLIRRHQVPAPAQEPVAGVPTHVVALGTLLEDQVALPMTAPGLPRVGHVDVLVPEEVNAYIIKQYTHKARP